MGRRINEIIFLYSVKINSKFAFQTEKERVVALFYGIAPVISEALPKSKKLDELRIIICRSKSSTVPTAISGRQETNRHSEERRDNGNSIFFSARGLKYFHVYSTITQLSCERFRFFPGKNSIRTPSVFFPVFFFNFRIKHASRHNRSPRICRAVNPEFSFPKRKSPFLRETRRPVTAPGEEERGFD